MTFQEKFDRVEMMPHMLFWLALLGLYLVHNNLQDGLILSSLFVALVWSTVAALMCFLLPPLLYLLMLFAAVSMSIQVRAEQLTEHLKTHLAARH